MRVPPEARLRAGSPGEPAHPPCAILVLPRDIFATHRIVLRFLHTISTLFRQGGEPPPFRGLPRDHALQAPFKDPARPADYISSTGRRFFRPSSGHGSVHSARRPAFGAFQCSIPLRNRVHVRRATVFGVGGERAWCPSWQSSQSTTRSSGCSKPRRASCGGHPQQRRRGGDRDDWSATVAGRLILPRCLLASRTRGPVLGSRYPDDVGVRDGVD
jgi:hypothetical protein